MHGNMSPARPFIIYALPRSRTVWLSHFLTYGGWTCLHDPLAHMRPAGIACRLRMLNTGVIDTGLVQYWREMRWAVPNAKIITIRRDVLDVRDSLLKLGLDYPIAHFYQHLEDVEREPDVISIKYEDLDKPETCLWLLAYLTGNTDLGWYQGLRKSNIQLNIEKLRLEKRVV